MQMNLKNINKRSQSSIKTRLNSEVKNINMDRERHYLMIKKYSTRGCNGHEFATP